MVTSKGGTWNNIGTANIDILINDEVTSPPWVWISDAKYFYSQPQHIVNEYCAISYTTVSGASEFDNTDLINKESGTLLVNANYKVTLKAAHMYTNGLYSFEILVTGYVETGSTPTANFKANLNLKVCDSNIATFGDFTLKPRFKPYSTGTEFEFGSLSCGKTTASPCVVNQEVWAPISETGALFRLYPIDFPDNVDSSINRYPPNQCRMEISKTGSSTDFETPTVVSND